MNATFRTLHLICILLLALLGLGQIPLHAVNPRGTAVGAIRWDGNTGDTPTFGWANGNYVGQQVERALGPNQYHFRLPFFGVETGTDTAQARELTQAVMDRDIIYATTAGIDYWAFVFYPDGSGMDTARNLYSSSPYKSYVNYCFVASGQMPTTYFSTLVTKFAESTYQKVLGNRPLLYIFGTGVYSASDITSLRNQTVAAGMGTPYIVVMTFSASAASTEATNIGADAISSYCSPEIDGALYSTLVSAENSNWNSFMATGTKVVPWVTSGWDPRPRIDHPVTWTSYPSTEWCQTATPWQIASHLQEGLNWVDSNPTVADANTVIMYAWNEFDEGGWLCPTLYTGTDRLDMLKAILDPAVVGSNLLANPSFETGTTSWVAQSGTIAQSTTMVHSGSYSLHISNRSAIWGTATQDVKSTLLAKGQGLYTASTWAALGNGSDTIRIVIHTTDSTGSYWFTTSPMTLGTAYKQLAGVINVTWSGTLSSAIIYTQTTSSLADLYEDDFSLGMANLLANPGFENGASSWAAQTSSIAASSTNVHNGTGSLQIYNRTAIYGAATQNVTNVLLANGQGDYTASAWAQFASGTDNVILVINTTDSTGSHWFTSAPVSISTRYKNISDTIHITWTGTLSRALIYTQTATSLADLYEDDFSLSKLP
jgi:hypothetical protein